MPRRIRKSDDASPFKRTVAIVGLISAVIAVAIGGYQIVDSILKALEVKREVQAHIFVADRFFALKNYEAATEEYKKAVSLDIPVQLAQVH
jgi:hypothetical protein